MTHYDAIVIGAGVGGLAAGIALAAEGRRVHIVDALERPGGKLNIERLDGVEVDTGPSVLTMTDVLDDVFARAGRSPRVRLFRPAPATRYAFPDGTVLDVPHEKSALHKEVSRVLGASAAEELAGFLDYAADIWSVAEPHFVQKRMPGIGEMFRIGRKAPRLLARLDPLRTMQKAIRARVADDKLIAILERYATYNGSDPRRAPATLNCIAHVELSLGLHGVDGGMYELVRDLVDAFKSCGGTTALNTRVRAIEHERGRARAVVLESGARLSCEHVVANVDARHLYEHLLKPRVQRKVGAPSTSGWNAIIKARRRADRPPHALLMPARYDREFEDLFDAERAPREPTVYVCAQEKAHRRQGWAEHEPLFVMANAPAVTDDDNSERDTVRLAAASLARLRTARWIDDDDEVLWSRTPVGLAQQFAGSRGSIYGAASNSMNAAFQRPDNVDNKIHNLYLASGSAHPGGGVPMCLRSGLLAADALLSSTSQQERRRA